MSKGDAQVKRQRHTARILVLLALLPAVAAEGQDALLSQFYANPLTMNPAMAGVEGTSKFYLGYRNQWPAASGAYSTYRASFDRFVDAVQGGIGVHVINDRQGDGIINTLSVDAIYAYHLKVTRRLTVTGGFQASVGQRSMNPDGLVLPDELAGLQGTSVNGYSRVFPDFAAGLGFFYGRFYGGIAAHHMLEPHMSPDRDPNTRLYRRYTVHAGALIPVYEKRFGKEIVQLSPNLVFIQQGIYQQLNYGLEAHYKSLLGGVWLRQDLRFSYGSLILSAGLTLDPFRFRYSYDAKISSPDVLIPSMGAHEISVVIVFEKLYKSTRYRAIKSPKI